MIGPDNVTAYSILIPIELYLGSMCDILELNSQRSISGKSYHSKHGDEWPGKEDPGPGLKNPSPKDALLVVLAMSFLLALLKGFFERLSMLTHYVILLYILFFIYVNNGHLGLGFGCSDS